MKLSTFLVIATIVAFIFGLAFILAPAESLKPYGTTTDLTGLFLARYLGASLLGMGFLMWVIRDAPASPTRKAVLSALFVTMVLGLIIAVYDKFAGAGNSFIWINVFVYLVLAIGFGYFAFTKAEEG